MNSDDPIIKVENLGKVYKTKTGEKIRALKGVNFDVGEGSFVTVVGPSGCGKSTLLLNLAGVLPYSEGTIHFKNRPVRGPRRGIGMVFQNPALCPWRTNLENILLPAEILDADMKEARERAMDLLELVGLKGFEDKYPDELSGGMQQRVSICRALLHKVDLLLMDEPFGALDAMTRDELNIELLRIWDEEKKTIVFVTHYIPEAVFLADYTIVLSSRPGSVIDIKEIPLPRPRNWKMKGEDEFISTIDEIREDIGLKDKR